MTDMTDAIATAPPPQEPAPREPPSRGLHYVLVGPDGLRAGWSLLLFVAMVAAMTAAFSVAYLYLVHPPKTPDDAPMKPWHAFLADGVPLVIFVVASAVMARIERRPFQRYGLVRRNSVADVVTGMAWGLVMLSLLVGALWAAGVLAFDGVALGGGEAVAYGALWFASFALVGLFEEYFTRGYLQFTLARGVAGIVRAVAPDSRHARTIGFWVAAFVLSIALFAAGHLANGGETAFGIASVALAGVTFVYVLYRTGSLWWAIGFHATWDWAQSYLYGVHDSGLSAVGHLLNAHPVGPPLLSGGTTGPEGSVLILFVLPLTMLVIRLTLPRRPEAFDAPAPERV